MYENNIAIIAILAVCYRLYNNNTIIILYLENMNIISFS